MIIIDASVVIDVLTGGRRDLTRLDDGWAAPHLLDLEVAHVLRKQVLRGDLDQHAADAALTDFETLVIDRHPHLPLLPRIWQLRHNVTPYDAAYLALAEVLDAPLVTLDARLAGAPDTTALVEVLPL